MADEREELLALRRLAELEDKAAGVMRQTPEIIDNVTADPTEGMSALDKFLAGAGKGMTDIGRGIGQALGFVDQQSIDDAKKRDAALMGTGWGLTGNIAGSVAALAPTAIVPGANTLAGATALGAATGALNPVASDESRVKNALAGGAGGAAGNLLARGLARVLNPQTSKQVTDLMDEGITPTPGRILGGSFQRMEDAAESIPFVGTGIKDAKVRANNEFNLATLNSVLAPLRNPLNVADDAIVGELAERADDVASPLAARVGDIIDQPPDFPENLLAREVSRIANAPPSVQGSPVGPVMPDGAEQLLLGGPTSRASEGVLNATDEVMRGVPKREIPQITQAGHEGVEQAREVVRQAYADALSPIQKVTVDQQFRNSISKVREMGQTLIVSRRNQLNRILDDELGRITPAGTMSGETFKTIESSLKQKASRFLKSPDFDQQQIGDALNAVAGELRSLAGRNYPEAAAAIRRADAAYARLLRVERAAAGIGAQEGVFSPGQLASAIRGMDDSLRKLDSAQGKALMQNFAEPAKSVLGANMPNSGTADRLINTLLLGGGYAIDPSIAATAVGARAAYTAPGQKALAAILAKRPEASRVAGDYVRRLSPAASIAGSEFAQ